jgi:hypothetical protein
MFCPTDVNTGFIQLVGPILSSDLTAITTKRSPLSISFAPRSTTPSLVGNRIDEPSQENTCRYQHKKFTLVDVQIVSAIHSGYNLPGHTETPKAELILSFSANSAAASLSDLSGLLLCLPIYQTSVSSHDAYLNQIILNDPTVAIIPTLDTLFYSSNTDKSQSSFAYRTCFETLDDRKEAHSHSLAIIVFPNGIHVSAGTYQQLFSLLGQSLSTYQIPPGIRGGESTVRAYTVNDDGKKIPTKLDSSGIIYTSPLSTCSDDFKNRFEYFTLSPQLTSSSAKIASLKMKNCSEGFEDANSTLKGYKCVPFSQLRDSDGNYVSVKGAKDLDEILKNRPNASSSELASSNPFNEMSVAEIEGIVGGVFVGIVIIGAAFYYFKPKPTP